MPNTRRRGTRRRFQFSLDLSERDELVRRFIADNSNASEAVRNLIADYMSGKLWYADDVVREFQRSLSTSTITTAPQGSARTAESGGGGQVDPNDEYVKRLAGALKQGRR